MIDTLVEGDPKPRPEPRDLGTYKAYTVKVRANRGGRGFVPLHHYEVQASSYPPMEWERAGPEISGLEGLEESLTKRGDLFRLKDGSPRLRRRAHIGYLPSPGRNGHWFILVYINKEEPLS